MTGAALLGALSLAAGILACRRLSLRRLLLCLAGFLTGGALGALPGACFLFPALAANSAEPFPFHWIVPGFLFVCGGAVGALAGLLVLDRVTSRTRPRAWAWMTAGAGIMAGVVCSVLAFLFTANSPAWNLTCLILSPLCIVAAAVGGYALRAAPR
jgi:hypothetical protein